ncbi:dihydroneopterin triphosphate diphosphatase [Acidihalobacter prosperus]|uniref:NUDIX domain-containing protein n=1 Tax=Acidihalobacter prosperus TaxID=160660 RepID=A0A1A6C382_9GAMM|nr:dihydroneopterin triphosphate diphosphatase [Acidihalobacter prosperus]OBS09019.1 NUDIX domain-containing protein [Acidihalobacter prosperus]
MAWKRPESVLVIVAVRDGRMLLLERRRPRGFWQSVTGSLEAGETPAAAARRELCEETGLCDVPLIDARIARRFPIVMPWRHRYAPGIRGNLEHVFYVGLPRPRPVALNPHEHLRYRWLARGEALRRTCSWTDRASIRRGAHRHA